MVDDFRDYARVPPARLVPLDLNALIEEVMTLYRTAGAPVTLVLAPHLPLIEGDATQLRQVIHNLIGNAQEALAGHTDAKIAIRTMLAEIADASGIVRAVRFSVEDNGPGFAANILRRAFEPYITTKPSGTGLGLAMSWKAADRYSQDYIAMRTKDAVNFYKTPDSILRNQLEVWDKMLETKSAENPFFKKVADSMKVFAERTCRYAFDYNVDYRMAYNHYFGRPAAAPAKKT